MLLILLLSTVFELGDKSAPHSCHARRLRAQPVSPLFPEQGMYRLLMSS